MAKSQMSTYVLYDPLRRWVKIGRSIEVDKRVRSIRAASGADVQLLATIHEDRESEIHRRLHRDRVKGEWFRITTDVSYVVEQAFGCQIPPPTERQARHRWTSAAPTLPDEPVEPETWPEGSHCATPLKVAVIGVQLGLPNYRSTWDYLDRLAASVATPLPPCRRSDAEWYRIVVKHGWGWQQQLVDSAAAEFWQEGATA